MSYTLTEGLLKQIVSDYNHSFNPLESINPMFLVEKKNFFNMYHYLKFFKAIYSSCICKEG